MKNIQNIWEKNYSLIERNGKVNLSTWRVHELESLSELFSLQKFTQNKINFITPFSLVKKEKWYDAIWDEKILALEVQNESEFTREELLSLLSKRNIPLWKIEKSMSDEDFWKKVSQILDEIKNGNLCQCIISRKFFWNINVSDEVILSIFKKLLIMRGQYMTFSFQSNDKVFLWASPERHLTVQNGMVLMEPIAGTMPKWWVWNFYERLLDFLWNAKEQNELDMVEDETLKRVLKKCASGRIEGPSLKEIWAVIHTKADLIWKLNLGVSIEEVFRETLYAPTLVWGPLQSAFSRIAQYEEESRGYYDGVFWVLDRGFLDTCIVIRTAMIDRIKIPYQVQSWAWIVQGSTLEWEIQETVKKSQWFFWVLQNQNQNYKDYLSVLSKSEKRNIEKLLQKKASQLSQFYFLDNQKRNLEVPRIKGKKFLLLNNEDDFIFMLGFMIRKMWWQTEVKNTLDYVSWDQKNYDVVVLGPWPWDINNHSHPTMKKFLSVTESLIKENKKLLWVCLWHQAICKNKWFEVKRQEEITKWAVKGVSVDGKEYKLGFYNSFSPVIKDWFSWDTFFWDRVLTYSEENIVSMQFHPESILSRDGFDVLKRQVLKLF